MSVVFAKIKDDAIMRLTKLLEARDLKGVGEFSLNFTGQYRDLLAAQMRTAYEFGKHSASDELKVGAPGTKRDSLALINQNAQAITDKQMSDLLFIVKSEVLGELRKNQLSEVNLGLTDILATIALAFASFFDDKVGLTAAAVVMQSVNRGRGDVFESNQSAIYGYQWSARLENSCPICIDLDGSVLEYAGWRNAKWNPPVHFHCACIWVAILRNEIDPPAITGFPDAPGGVSSPSL